MRGGPMTAATPETNLGLQGERQERVEITRNRIRQIFRFLKDFNGLRNPVTRQFVELSWSVWVRELPTHSSVWLRGREPGDAKSNEGHEELGELLLRVRRADVPKPPAVPAILNGWLPNNWKDPTVDSVVPLSEREVRGSAGPEVEKFEAVRERVDAFRDWRVERNSWGTEARPAPRALRIFQPFYQLQRPFAPDPASVQLL